MSILSENLCPVTLEKPLAVKENDSLELRCSTLASCPHELTFSGLQASPQHRPEVRQEKNSIVVKITANREDDGREISCHTANNKDQYLIQKINLTVQCK